MSLFRPWQLSWASILLSLHTVGDAPTWGTWLRTLHWWRKVGRDIRNRKKRKKKIKSPAPCWIQTHDLQITRRVLFRCATTAAHEKWWWTTIVLNFRPELNFYPLINNLGFKLFLRKVLILKYFITDDVWTPDTSASSRGQVSKRFPSRHGSRWGSLKVPQWSTALNQAIIHDAPRAMLSS